MNYAREIDVNFDFSSFFCVVISKNSYFIIKREK